MIGEKVLLVDLREVLEQLQKDVSGQLSVEADVQNTLSFLVNDRSDSCVARHGA